MNSYYYRLQWGGLSKEPFSSQCQRAQKAVDSCSSEDVRLWYQNLLDILKTERYARVRLKDGSNLDVQRIAYTNAYASFFDCFNTDQLIDLSVRPALIDKLEFTIKYSH